VGRSTHPPPPSTAARARWPPWVPYATQAAPPGPTSHARAVMTPCSGGTVHGRHTGTGPVPETHKPDPKERESIGPASKD